jgi:hypothetical protein
MTATHSGVTNWRNATRIEDIVRPYCHDKVIRHWFFTVSFLHPVCCLVLFDLHVRFMQLSRCVRRGRLLWQTEHQQTKVPESTMFDCFSKIDCTKIIKLKSHLIEKCVWNRPCCLDCGQSRAIAELIETLRCPVLLEQHNDQSITRLIGPKHRFIIQPLSYTSTRWP